MRRYLPLITLLPALLFAASSKLDEKSGLVWQDNHAIPTELSQPEAENYCRRLKLDGFDRWRLPTIKELATIIDFKRYRPALRSGFDMRAEERFWSSTADAANPRNGWVVSFSYGAIESYPRSRQYYVRCVTDAPARKKP